MLFNEPKLLKKYIQRHKLLASGRFSALQRAEIAENSPWRARRAVKYRFSALQRAEIAEKLQTARAALRVRSVSVLFNEPKLLKT